MNQLRKMFVFAVLMAALAVPMLAHAAGNARLVAAAHVRVEMSRGGKKGLARTDVQIQPHGPFAEIAPLDPIKVSTAYNLARKAAEKFYGRKVKVVNRADRPNSLFSDYTFVPKYIAPNE